MTSIKSKIKHFSINITLTIVSVIIGVVICECFARVMENKTESSGSISYQQHDTLGFMATPGIAKMKTSEFETTWNINKYGMNDEPIENSSHISRNKIMVVGDSHTFAIGVSHNEAWPKVLEVKLFKQESFEGTVYNCSSVGYSLSQYLLKFTQMKNILNPDILIIGFSMATDLYDLIPPNRGGFVYGSKYGRVYHDLDSSKNLVEKYDLVGQDLHNMIKDFDEDVKLDRSATVKNWSLLLRSYLNANSALYRIFKTSNVAMWIAVHFTVGEQSLWPGLDTCLKIELSEDDKYRWDLGEQLIAQLATEAHNEKVKVILVNIPYLAVVYDDIWEHSFGSREDVYDRFITSKRLERICTDNNIYFLDCTQLYINEMKNREEWLHFHEDKHPNIQGHQIIAQGLSDFILERNILVQ